MQALPNCSIAEAEQQTGDGDDEEEEQQQASSPTKGPFGRTQAVKAQPPQVTIDNPLSIPAELMIIYCRSDDQLIKSDDHLIKSDEAVSGSLSSVQYSTRMCFELL